MKFSISQRWVIVLLTVVLPVILLSSSMVFASNICTFMAIMFWIGMVLIMAFIPYQKETA
mgnify:CR=1 FL=1